MKFAIVTPSFNKARYLKRSVLSVLEQNEEVDYWIFDNCSTDGSAEVLQELISSYPERLHVIAEPDNGQASAINRGFSLAKGEIMGWLNADDFYLPQTLAKVRRYFETHPDVGMVYGRARVLDGEFNFQCEYPVQAHDPRVLKSYDYIPQPTAFWRRSVWEAVGPLNEGLNWGLDWEFFVRVSDRFRVEFLDELLAEAVCDGQHKSATGGLAKTREFARIARKQGGWGNPTHLFCHYVLALNWLASPWLRHPKTAPAARELLERLKSYVITFSARFLRAQVMS